MRAIRRTAHLLAALPAVLGLAVALAGCGEDTPDDGHTRGLAILSGDVGDTRLTVVDAGGSHELALPDPALAWISGAPDGVLVATLADGRLAVRDTDADEDWRIINPPDGDDEIGSLLFGTASPDGARVASLMLAGAGQFGLALTDPGSGESVVFPIAAEVVLTGPAWIDAERIGVVVVDPDTVGAVAIVDVASGDLTGGPGNVRAFTLSANGTAVAWISTNDGRLYGSNARSWLAGEEIAALPIEGPRAAVPGSIALDATGARIAIVWENDAGEVVEIAIHRRTGEGWSTVERLDAPGGDRRAVVTWLR